jgi:hypothetical protein
MADESGLTINRRYIVWDTEKASLNKLQTNKIEGTDKNYAEFAGTFCIGVEFQTQDLPNTKHHSTAMFGGWFYEIDVSSTSAALECERNH